MSLWIILRSDAIMDMTFAHPLIYLLIMIGISVLFSKIKYDINFLSILSKKDKYIYMALLFLAILWIQIGLEWVININKVNYESFMLYEPILITMGFPISIFVHVTKALYRINNIQLNAFILWLIYFTASMAEYIYIFKKLKKWGRLPKHSDLHT